MDDCAALERREEGRKGRPFTLGGDTKVSQAGGRVAGNGRSNGRMT